MRFEDFQALVAEVEPYRVGTRNGSDVVSDTESLPTTDDSVFPPTGVWVSPSLLVSTP